MKKIIQYINTENWDNALSYIPEFLELYGLTDQTAVIAASIYEHFSNSEKYFFYIQEGLKYNPSNYKLYPTTQLTTQKCASTVYVKPAIHTVRKSSLLTMPPSMAVLNGFPSSKISFL